MHIATCLFSLSGHYALAWTRDVYYLAAAPVPIANLKSRRMLRMARAGILALDPGDDL
jgi:hypothetical protein